MILIVAVGVFLIPWKDSNLYPSTWSCLLSSLFSTFFSSLLSVLPIKLHGFFRQTVNYSFCLFSWKIVVVVFTRLFISSSRWKSTANRIWTGVTGMKILNPWPLDDGCFQKSLKWLLNYRKDIKNDEYEHRELNSNIRIKSPLVYH